MKILNLLNFLLLMVVIITFLYNTISQFIFIHSRSDNKNIRGKSLFYFISMFLLLDFEFKTKLWLLFHIPLRAIEPECLSKLENLAYRRTFRFTRFLFFLSTILLAINLILYFEYFENG